MRSDLGITPRDFDDAEIVARTMAAMVNEAARTVADGTALRPLDVDVVKAITLYLDLGVRASALLHVPFLRDLDATQMPGTSPLEKAMG